MRKRWIENSAKESEQFATAANAVNARSAYRPTPLGSNE
jgi:hypothetical protein